MNKRSILTLTFLLLVTVPLSQVFADKRFPMQGNWAAPCLFFGNEAQCHLEWRSGQHDSLLEMTYTVSTTGDEPRALFNGKSTLKRDAETFRGYWSASNGAMHPVFARLDGAQLESHWGDASTEQGRSRYQLTASGQLHVTDWVLTDEGWRLFMEVEYTRQ